MTRAHAEWVRKITADTGIPDQGTVKDAETTGWLQTEHKPQESGEGEITPQGRQSHFASERNFSSKSSSRKHNLRKEL